MHTVPPPLPLLTREGKLWLLVTALLFATGLYKGINLLLLLSYMLAGLWVMNWVLVQRSMRILSASREWRTPVLAGEATDWRIVLQNDTAEPLRGFQVREQIGPKTAFWTVDRLQPNGRVYLRDTVTFSQRGWHPPGYLRVVSRFPFGLAQRGMDLPGDRSVLVLPRLGTLKLEAFKQWLARAARGEGRNRRHKPFATLRQADLHGLRPFRPGDSPRWIDWKSSARRNELYVREFENDAPPKLILIVEAWMPKIPSVGDRRRLEDIISLAATICRDWCEDQSSDLQLIVLEQEMQLKKAASGIDRAWPLIELLAPLQGADKTAHLSQERIGRRKRATDSILVVSSRPAGSISEEAEQFYHRPVSRLNDPGKVDWYAGPS